MSRRPGVACQTCAHPDRERIEQEIAITRSLTDVEARWGIHRRALNRHRSHHMTQEQIARLRGLVPAKVEVDIAELTRRGGEDAMVGLKRLNAELIATTAKLDGIGDYATAARYRDLQFKVYREQMKIGALYPGLKQVTNNNLVVAGGSDLFQMVADILTRSQTIEEARRAVSERYLQLSVGDVIEGEIL